MYNSLAALVVLEGVQPQNVCSYYLDQKTLHLTEMLTHASGNSVSEISNHLCRVVSYIQNTLRIFVELFYSEMNVNYFQQCLQYLQQSKQDESSTLIADLYAEKASIHVLFRHLPSQVRYFSPLIPSHKPFDNDEICALARNWMDQLVLVFQKCAVLNGIYSGASISQVFDIVLKFVYDIEHNDSSDVAWSKVLIS